VAAFKLINATEIFSITANLGDTKSTITHPATTTHGRLSDEDKTNANITNGLIRLSIGLEDANDLIADISKGLLV
jgi:O-succinylhomoserine sulfhydrylase